MENLMFKEVDVCRCCGSNKLFKYLDLGKQPLANSYHKNDIVLDTYDLKVNVCLECYHSQLSVVVDPDIMFKHYLYVSGTTKTFNKHCEDFAKYATELYGSCDVKVNDIACNDGTLLEKFRDLGCEVSGVDPAQNLRTLTEEKNINVVVDFWSENLSKTITEKFDIITGTNVFAHVDDITGFLNGCKNIISENGLVILEFPYGKDFIRHNEFDTVYHEHLSYFTIRSFKALTDKIGFKIFDILKTPIHGGSIRIAISLDRKENLELINKELSEESDAGLHNIEIYKKFQENVDSTKEEFTNFCNDKNVIGYAASAKGNTALNYFAARNVSYIVDDNSLKVGYFTPGCDIEIKNVADGLNVNEDLVIVILAWNFKNEITEKIKAIRGNKKTTLVFYVPNFYTVEI